MSLVTRPDAVPTGHPEPPKRFRWARIPNLLFMFLIHAYQRILSPVFPPSCRFRPTCSNYSLQAFRKYPLHKALYLSIRRIVRCNPFHPGGYDPLP